MAEEEIVRDAVSNTFREEISKCCEKLNKINKKIGEAVLLKKAYEQKSVEEPCSRTSVGMVPLHGDGSLQNKSAKSALRPAANKYCGKRSVSKSEQQELMNNSKSRNEPKQHTDSGHNSLDETIHRYDTIKEIKVIIGHASKLLSLSKEDNADISKPLVHDWICYVSSDKHVKLEHFVEKVQFRLPSYKPNYVANMRKPPFIIQDKSISNNAEVEAKLFFYGFIQLEPLLLKHTLRFDKDDNQSKILWETLYYINFPIDSTAQAIHINKTDLQCSDKFAFLRTQLGYELEELPALISPSNSHVEMEIPSSAEKFQPPSNSPTVQPQSNNSMVQLSENLNLSLLDTSYFLSSYDDSLTTNSSEEQSPATDLQPTPCNAQNQSATLSNYVSNDNNKTVISNNQSHESSSDVAHFEVNRINTSNSSLAQPTHAQMPEDVLPNSASYQSDDTVGQRGINTQPTGGNISLLKPKYKRYANQDSSMSSKSNETEAQLNAISVANDHSYLPDPDLTSDDKSNELKRQKCFEDRFYAASFDTTQQAVETVLNSIALHGPNKIFDTPEEQQRVMRAEYIEELLSRHPSIKRLAANGKDHMWKANEIFAFDINRQKSPKSKSVSD